MILFEHRTKDGTVVMSKSVPEVPTIMIGLILAVLNKWEANNGDYVRIMRNEIPIFMATKKFDGVLVDKCATAREITADGQDS